MRMMTLEGDIALDIQSKPDHRGGKNWWNSLTDFIAKSGGMSPLASLFPIVCIFAMRQAEYEQVVNVVYQDDSSGVAPIYQGNTVVPFSARLRSDSFPDNIGGGIGPPQRFSSSIPTLFAIRFAHRRPEHLLRDHHHNLDLLPFPHLLRAFKDGVQATPIRSRIGTLDVRSRCYRPSYIGPPPVHSRCQDRERRTGIEAQHSLYSVGRAG